LFDLGKANDRDITRSAERWFNERSSYFLRIFDILLV